LCCFIYRYDPYDKKFTEEFYDHVEMRNVRKQAISEASNASRFGLILGTLGHQGSTKVVEHLQVYIGWNTQIELIWHITVCGIEKCFVLACMKCDSFLHGKLCRFHSAYICLIKNNRKF